MCKLHSRTSISIKITNVAVIKMYHENNEPKVIATIDAFPQPASPQGIGRIYFKKTSES